MEKCECKEAGFCPKYNRTMSAKDWSVCQGINTAEEHTERYRGLWTKLAAVKGVKKDSKCGCKSSTASKKLLLTNFLCPGDILVMTIAINCLHRQHSGVYETAVKTSCDAIFENNPHIVKAEDHFEPISMEYPLIHSCNQRPVHFMQGYVDFLSQKLNIKLDCDVNRPFLYLAEDEKKWVNQVQESFNYRGKFWLISSGTKSDYTVKGWGIENYQAVVDHFKGQIQFVQIGEAHHNHPSLKNVLNLVGKTDARQLIRLAWHAQGGLGGVSFLHHIFSAYKKPFVCIASGMEPPSWARYNTERYITKFGTLPCAKTSGCWKSRVIPLNDNDPKDKSLCELPVFLDSGAIPKCMALIKPQEVIEAIEDYYRGGILVF